MDAVTVGLRPRAYLGLVQKLLADPLLRRAVVLLGPRRVRKTIRIRHLIADLLDSGVSGQRVAYVEMDHPLLHGQSLADLVGHVKDIAPGGEGVLYLFFDEVQSHKDWEKHLKPLVDHRPDLRILVSGSAAAALKRQSTESGVGRFTDFLLPPLAFSEYLQLRTEPAAIHGEEPGLQVLADITRLNYARWGTDDTEVELVESSPALRPMAALEIQWRDHAVDRPEELKGLTRLGRRHRLSLVWATTRTRFGEFQEPDGPRVRLWPAAVLAFHHGARAVKGRMGDWGADQEQHGGGVIEPRAGVCLRRTRVRVSLRAGGACRK